MTRATASAVLLLSSSILTAQSSRGLQPQSLSYHLDSQVVGCPVLMQAQQRPSNHLLVTRNGQQSETIAQRISLKLTGKHIASGSIRAHGLAAKGRVVQSTASPEAQFGDITRFLTVAFATNADQSASADLMLSGFTAVTFIDLVSLNFSDGIEWRASTQQPCSIVPDPLMLVSNR
jgi:hypothetical protein